MIIDEKDVFVEALALTDAGAREAYLQAACAGHPELLGRLRELLSAHEESQGPLDRRPVAPGVTVDASHTEIPGTVIGPYKLLQQIGEGGMGTVFMAEQTEPIQRKVALKVIKPGMDSRQVIARFEAERQALAMMDHVNISRVFDGGATESGRPYFVMELVPGVPITQYCDDNRLTPRERLELFVPVCQAIQHAHQKGVIHRDIKPSNVMVTLYDGKPVPKVIDFGVAKATERRLTDRTLFTQYGTVVGTLEYMSPEQAEMSALGVDTRSDIYSLGVLLYELLTGNTPLSHKTMKEAAYGEILRMIREEEPQKPSTRLSDSGEALASISANRHTEPAKLSKLMRGELDWIVMKCLEKDRSRRYETATGLAADVQRYLNDEPVQACPPSSWYRFRKFARRNKAGLATAGLVLFFIVLLGGVVGWGVRDREAREQEIAVETARQLSLTEQGIRQALDRGATIRAELHGILKKPGGVQQLLNQSARWELFIKTAQGELAQARRLAVRSEGSLDAASILTMAKFEQQSTGDQTDYDLALRLEKIRLDRATWVNGRFDNRQAIDQYPKAFAGFALLTDDPAAVAARIRSSPIKEQLVAALDDWAMVAYSLRNEPLAEQLLAVARQAAPDPAWGDRLRQFKVWRDQAVVGKLAAEAPVAGLSPQLLYLVGALLRNDNPLKESWQRQAQAQHPADFWLNFDLANTLYDLSSTPTETNPMEAAGFYRVALAVRPGNSTVYNNLGNALADQKKLPEAIAAYRKAIALDPKHALVYANLAKALRTQGKLDEAIDICLKVTTIDPKFAGAYITLGNSLLNQEKLPAAIAAYHKAIAIDPKYALAHYNLGNALRAQNKVNQAVAAYRKAIAIDPKYADAHINLGNTFADQGKLDDAIVCYLTAIKIHQRDWYAHLNLGKALADQKKLPEAEAAYRKAIAIDPKRADAHYGLGVALFSQGKVDDAIACYRKAIEIDPKFANAHHNLGGALDKQKKPDEAIACYRKAIEIDPRHSKAHVSLGIGLYGQMKLDEAVAWYRKAIEIDSEFANAHYGLGSALKAQGKVDVAIVCFRRAIELDPKHPYAHSVLGNALTMQGWGLINSPDLKLRNPKRALEAVTEGVELAPNSSLAWQYLGWIHYRTGNWKASIEALEKSCKLQKGGDSGQWIVLALAHAGLAAQEGLCEKERERHKAEAHRRYEEASQQVDNWGHGRPGDSFGQAIWDFRAEAAALLGLPEPGRAYALFEQAQSLRDQKKFAEAETALREVIRLKPALLDAYRMLGWMLQSQGKFPEQEAAFREVVRLKPNDAGGQQGLGRALLHQKKFRDAIAPLREALRLGSKDHWVHDGLGWALVEQKQPAEAEVAFREAVRLKPAVTNGYFGLGRALVDQKNFAEAEKALREALRLNPSHPWAGALLGQALIGQGKLAEAEELEKKAKQKKQASETQEKR